MMTVEVLHSRYASKHLTSSMINSITVVNVDGPFEPSAESPAYRLESHVRGCVRLVPADKPIARDLVGPMFGGNFATTSDSRFSRAIEDLTGTRFYGAVAIHDHFETAEEYASNSY